MFPFTKKKAPESPKPDEVRERVNKRLDETHSRLEAAVAEMKRRLAEKERHPLPATVAK